NEICVDLPEPSMPSTTISRPAYRLGRKRAIGGSTFTYHIQYMPRYAAIDIGSNSIRMEAAEVVPGSPTRILASEREVTRLGESVFRTGVVSEDAMRASCTVLARMAALYRRLEVIGVRA